MSAVILPKDQLMKAARIVVLTIAIGAGGAAAMLAGRMQPDTPPPQTVDNAAGKTVEVLVAKGDVGLGQTLTAQSVEWQPWPAGSNSAQFIKRSDQPRAVEQIVGSVARSSFISGEPIRESKLIKANGSGFMAAILSKGKRAISAEITPENGASGFILPNDHVDVILTRAQKTAGIENYVAETLLTNVRVLAIDQQIEEKSGQRVVVGKIALLELEPQQAETIAVSRRMGTLSLILRSLADSTAPDAIENPENRQRVINIVRAGQSTPTLSK